MWDHIIWSTSTIQVVWGIVNLSRNIHKLQIEDGSWTWIPHHTSFFPWYSQWFLEHLIGPIDIHHDDSPIHVTYHYVSLYIMFIHSTSLYIIMYHIYIYISLCHYMSLYIIIIATAKKIETLEPAIGDLISNRYGFSSHVQKPQKGTFTWKLT